MTSPMFNLAIDSKLRGCDVVALNVEDIAPHGYATDRATVRQIAERAGLGTSTLYFHITSKEALFREIVGPVIESGTEWIEEMARSDLPADEKFRLACIESVELYDRLALGK